MATRLLLPKQGLQMTEGTIVAWLKKTGERVSRGEPVVEMETDKTTMQIESPVDGVLLAVLCDEGDTVPVATTIAFIGEPGESIAAGGSSRGHACPPVRIRREPTKGGEAGSRQWRGRDEILTSGQPVARRPCTRRRGPE